MGRLLLLCQSHLILIFPILVFVLRFSWLLPLQLLPFSLQTLLIVQLAVWPQVLLSTDLCLLEVALMQTWEAEVCLEALLAHQVFPVPIHFTAYLRHHCPNQTSTNLLFIFVVRMRNQVLVYQIVYALRIMLPPSLRKLIKVWFLYRKPKEEHLYFTFRLLMVFHSSPF